MKLFSKTRSRLKKILGIRELTEYYRSIINMVKGFYDYNTHKIGHTGQQKVVYVPLAFLDRRQRDFRNLVLLFALILCFGLFYFFYLFIHKLWIKAWVVLCFCLFISALCFRYHFWWMQVKKRQLGCTFVQWKEAVVQELSGKIKK